VRPSTQWYVLPLGSIPKRILGPVPRRGQIRFGVSPLLVIPDGTPSRPRGVQAATACRAPVHPAPGHGLGVQPLRLCGGHARAIRLRRLPAHATLFRAGSAGGEEYRMPNEPWVSVQAVANHLGVAKDSISRWIDHKGLPAQKIGRL